MQRDLSELSAAAEAAVPRRADHRPQQRQGRRASPAPSPASTSSTRRPKSPPATSRRRRTSSTCCGSRRAWPRNQVLLRVRFAEVSRTAMTELGAIVLRRTAWTTAAGSAGHDRRSSSPRRPWYDDGKLRVQRLPQPVPLRREEPMSAASIRALQNKGLFQSLAEPNLIAENGKEASFLAGGEYPYPVVQGQGGCDQHHDSVQGIRRPAELHADHRRHRSGQAEGAPGSQLARLRQRRHACRASACRRSRRAAPRRKWNCRTARRSRSPA